MTKHRYLFSYSARGENGHSVSGRYLLTGKELLHLHVDVFDEVNIVIVENEIKEKLGYIDILVVGVIELPMKVKR